MAKRKQILSRYFAPAGPRPVTCISLQEQHSNGGAVRSTLLVACFCPSTFSLTGKVDNPLEVTKAPEI